MKIYSYRIHHDYGLAPNPFGEYCTLVVCKPIIRKSSNLEIGDWIIGTGSRNLENLTSKSLINKLIYAMKIKEKIKMENYWNDPRFQYKKPNMQGSLVSRFGDNIYFKDTFGKWQQKDSAHSNLDGSCNQDHLKKDVSGVNALISDDFYYFGDRAPELPVQFDSMIIEKQGQKLVRPLELCLDFISWLSSNFSRGIHGDPLNWAEFKQPSLF
jgi:hypothetical protein